MTATLPIAVTVESPDPVSDAELLDRFVTVRDPAAFTELVHRYSALVLGVCRRVLRDPCDVEDVFQATFLVLVRDGARIRWQQSLASWLYGVAYRLALRVARQKQRRRETMIAEDDGHAADTLSAVADRYDQQLVDTELNSLPDRYRQPMVLRYLCGKSSQEIADDLQVTVGTVDGLLKRGKDELRTRLMRRGVTLGAALAAVQGTREVLQSLDYLTLVDQTVQAGLAWQNGLDSPTEILSNRALELSGKELVAMTTMTKSGVAAGLALGALVLGWGALNLVDHGGAGRAEAGLISSVRTSVAAATAVEVAAIGQGAALVEEVLVEPIHVAQAAPIEPVVTAGPQETTERAAEALPTSSKGGRVAGGPTEPPLKPWDTRPRNDRVIRIDAALRQLTEISFTENPLAEALNYLSDLHHVEITVDKHALLDAGVTDDTPISMKISGVSLKSGLRLVLDPLGLDYVIRNETLTITTQAKAAELFETRVYSIRRLKGMTPAELDEIIRATIEPESWNSIRQTVDTPPRAGEALSRMPGAEGGGGIGMGGGGPSNSEGNIRHTMNTLVIRQTQRVHDEIVDLLNQLEKSAEEPEPVTTNALPKSVRVSY